MWSADCKTKVIANSEASKRELAAFLGGTHPRLGRGTLPLGLAQRGGELLRLVSDFVLALVR